MRGGDRHDIMLKATRSFGLQMKLLEVSLDVTSALLESDSDSSLTIPFSGSVKWRKTTWNRGCKD